MSTIWDLLSGFLQGSIQEAVERTLASDPRNDPVYKRNIQKLIEHHRQFEKKDNEPHT